MASTTVNAPQLRGLAFTIVIVASFAAMWGVNGSVALFGAARGVTLALVLLVTLVWFGIAFSFHRAARQFTDAPNTTPNLFRTRAFQIAVLAECIAIPVVSRLLIQSGRPDAVMPAVAIIVGLHFFGFIRALQSWIFAIVGSAMVLLAVFSLTLPPDIVVQPSGQHIAVRIAVVGLGCAVILWAGIVPIVAATRRQVGRHGA